MSPSSVISAQAGEGLEPLFPAEDGTGLALSRERIKALSRLYSPLYAALLAELVPGAARELGVPERAASLVLREALVSPVHLFLDRLLRLEQKGRGLPAPAVAAAPAARDYDDVAALRTAAYDSVVFNAGLLAELAPLLGWPLADAPAPHEPEKPAAPKGRNANFDGETFGSKLRRKLLGLLPRRGGRLPCASLSYSDSALRGAGFLLRRLEPVTGRARWRSAPRDAELRARLLAGPVSASPAVDAFLDAAGWPAERAKKPVRAALGAWLARQCPSAYLEALAGNLAAGQDVLRPFAPRAFVISECNDVDATLLMASARCLGMPVVGLQHGGHYGYMEDHTHPLDIEYPYYDRFVSWGWEGMPDWDSCRHIPVTPLSCPWLQLRREHWGRELPPAQRDPRGKAHDLYLMTNKLYRFPPAPSGGAVCRSDRAVEIRASLAALAEAAAAKGLSLLHKPYNQDAVGQLRGTFGDMKAALGERYTELPGSSKGLTPEQLRVAGLVVWDQPGTGFLECLAAGLPTLCYWPRVYTEEEARRRPQFAALEAAGLVHRTAEGVAEETLRFKADPDGWMAAKRGAAEAFSREFGRADAGWAEEWDRFFVSLGAA